MQELNDLRDAWAAAYVAEKRHLPLILHQECYEYIGTPVKIVEANIFDTVANAEVTIQTWNGDGDQIDFYKLSWYHHPRYEKRDDAGPADYAEDVQSPDRNK